MQHIDKQTVARTLKECVGYLLKDCEEAGFSAAAIHLRIAEEELKAVLPIEEITLKKTARPS